MKILVVCQYYSPEPFRISDICEQFVKNGNEVTVLTGVPNYPKGKIYKEYRWGKQRKEIINGVKVLRCFTIGRKRGVFFRFLNYYSFAISSSIYATFLKEKYDLVFVNQLSPVMMANAAIKYKKKHGTKVFLYCLDLWPESLIAGGVKKGSLLYNHYYKVSEKIYKAMDQILISSKMFSNYFETEFGIKDTLYLPQYAETLFTDESCRKVYDDKIDLMFAGNIGSAQSIDTIIYAADRTKDIKNLYWHIVGDGSELERIKKLSRELNVANVIFHGQQPLERMPEFYSKADAMIITMKKNDVISFTLPGKMQTYMAAGKPILGAIDGEAAVVIKESGCGFCCNAEDSEGLADIVRRFAEDNNTQRYGRNALDFYNRMFKKETVFAKLSELLKK